jgi:hypothetical protein
MTSNHNELRAHIGQVAKDSDSLNIKFTDKF